MNKHHAEEDGERSTSHAALFATGALISARGGLRAAGSLSSHRSERGAVWNRERPREEHREIHERGYGVLGRQIHYLFVALET